MFMKRAPIVLTRLVASAVLAGVVSCGGGDDDSDNDSAAPAAATIRVNFFETDVRLGDLAIDTAGDFWVNDMATAPGHLYKIDRSTGVAIQTIDMTDIAFGGAPFTQNLSGLQVLTSALTLGTTKVSPLTLLVFDGITNPDRVIAVNPVTEAVLATLVLSANYDLTSGVYDAGSGLLLLASSNGATGTEVVAVNPVTGAQVASTTTGINVLTWSGMAIQPSTGHLWLGSFNGGPQVIEFQINAGGTLTELRRVNIASQGPNSNEISGLAFDAAGKLCVSSIKGVIYVVTV
jgi:hypothetical protein